MDKSKALVVVEHEVNVPDIYNACGSRLDYEFFENFASEHTKVAYRIDLKQFFEFVLGQIVGPMSVTDLKRVHVITFRNHLQSHGGRRGKPCCPKTVIRKLASVSSYCEFLVEKGLLAVNPASSVKR